MGAVTFQLVVIKTNDLPKLVAFYSALGLTFEHHRHGNGPMHFSAAVGSLMFELYPLPKNVAQPDTTSRLGFIVDDLDALIGRLKMSGNTVIMEPAKTEWGYSAIVQDPDGRKIELTWRDDAAG